MFLPVTSKSLLRSRAWSDSVTQCVYTHTVETTASLCDTQVTSPAKTCNFSEWVSRQSHASSTYTTFPLFCLLNYFIPQCCSILQSQVSNNTLVLLCYQFESNDSFTAAFMVDEQAVISTGRNLMSFLTPSNAMPTPNLFYRTDLLRLEVAP